MRQATAALPLALLLGACVSVAPADPADTCRAEPAKVYSGQTATAELGAELLRQTHAREIRWVPPGTAVTMDYRPWRLTVAYDETMRIISITCG